MDQIQKRQKEADYWKGRAGQWVQGQHHYQRLQLLPWVSTTLGDWSVCSVIGKGKTKPHEGPSPTFSDSVLHVPNPKMPDIPLYFGRRCPLFEVKPEDLISGMINGFCRHKI